MKIIKHGSELRDFDCKVVLYGGGKYGRRLYEEAFLYAQMDRVFVCDSDKRVCLEYPRYVWKEDLRKFEKENADAVIVICVQNEEIVREIYSDIISNNWCLENIYQYMPEDLEEFINRKTREGFFNGEKNVFIMEDQDAEELIRTMVVGGKPFLIARWGATEGQAVFHNRIGMLSDVDFKHMYNLSGIFPINDTSINDYINVTEHAARQMDIMCVGFWCKQIEELFRLFSPEAILVNNAVLPPSLNTSWMEALRHKKVLVVHPFAALIEKQYQKREKLFEDPGILPEFTLRTYQAVQSLGGNNKYSSWIEALKKMEIDIAKIDFDIALIGCGAYGMPLGAFIKENLRKQAVHVGGMLQLLFGIKGRRWDVREDYKALYNEHWVRPSEDLRPDNWKSVEDGCYW